MVWLARVDDRDGIGEVSLCSRIRRDARIERRAPRLGNHVDGCCRIAARRQCPKHLVDIRRIDIIIYNDDETAVITIGGTQHRHGGSLRMPAVLLLDGNRGNIPGRILPYALDIGDSGFLQSQPHVGRAKRHGLS